MNPSVLSYPGMIAQRLETAMNRNKVPQKSQVLGPECWRPTSLICSLNSGHDDLEEALPRRGGCRFGREPGHDQPRANRHHEHQRPGRDDRAIRLEKAVPPENQVIGCKAGCEPPLPIESALPAGTRVSRLTTMMRTIINPSRHAASLDQ